MFKRQSNGWKAILTLSVGISNASSSLLALVHHFKCISNPAPGHTSKVRWQLLCPGPGWFNNWQTPLAVFSYHLAVKHLTAIWKMNEAKEVSYWCGQCAMTCLLHRECTAMLKDDSHLKCLWLDIFQCEKSTVNQILTVIVVGVVIISVSVFIIFWNTVTGKKTFSKQFHSV